jgi:DNA-directed RNA polymerase specialized sigma24 family protein
MPAMPTEVGQLYLFQLGDPIRRRPTRDEIDAALEDAVRLAVYKRHHGRPPVGMDFDDLHQEVMIRANTRIANFEHGGRKTLFEYTYVAACFALTDIHRESMRREAQRTLDINLPLLDSIDAA